MNAEQIAKLNLAGIYYEATGQCLREQDMPLVTKYSQALANALAERATSPVSQMTDIEKAAEAIYKLIPANTEGAPEDYPWQPGGNSHMQDLARRMARAAVAKKGGAA